MCVWISGINSVCVCVCVCSVCSVYVIYLVTMESAAKNM